MMSAPLLISTIIEHAARNSGSTEIVSRRVEGDIHRTTYRQVRDRSKQLANALAALGVQPGDRVGTLAWNGYRHLEIYYGVSGSGSVCHTINPRLFPDQIAYIVNHADDQYVFFDLTFVPLIEGIAAHCPNVKGWVAMTDRAHMPASSVPMLCYEELLDAQSSEYTWPQFDENTASSLCYTSGTTGNPKGALYSHRSTVLHSYASALPDALGVSAQDVILPVVPMFHVNAWGTPYSVALVGAKMVFPGPKLDGASLYELFEQEKVTFSAGVPTVWLGLLQHVQANNLKFSTFRRTVIGGSACPPAMIRTLKSMDVSNSTTALGVAVALGEIEMPRAEQIHKDLSLFSAVASCSSGVELDQAQIVVLGNVRGVGGRFQIGHSVMKDALDADGVWESIRNAGLDLPERPHSSDLKGRVVNVFCKCEADPTGRVHDRRNIMLDDSDVHWHRQIKSCVGGVVASVTGDPAVFVSVAAVHQGPSGGGPVIAIVDHGA